MSVMEGKEDIFDECRQKLLPTWLTASAFWLPVQAVNFFLVPARARLVYVSCCCLVWDNAMCIFKRSKIKTSESGEGLDGPLTILGISSSSERTIKEGDRLEGQSSKPLKFKELDFRETIINPSQVQRS